MFNIYIQFLDYFSLIIILLQLLIFFLKKQEREKIMYWVYIVIFISETID